MNLTSSDCLPSGSYAPIGPKGYEGKLLSICQDIVSVASRGAKLTPKSLGLGLSVKHITGSSQVLRILSGLDHALSGDTLLRLETGLAILEANSDSLPKFAVEDIFTILIYDNIDFG